MIIAKTTSHLKPQKSIKTFLFDFILRSFDLHFPNKSITFSRDSLLTGPFTDLLVLHQGLRATYTF